MSEQKSAHEWLVSMVRAEPNLSKEFSDLLTRVAIPAVILFVYKGGGRIVTGPPVETKGEDVKA